MATHDVEGVGEDDGTGGLLERRPGAWWEGVSVCVSEGNKL